MILFLTAAICRDMDNFRIRHRKKELYIGGKDFYPTLKRLGDADVFQQESTGSSDGNIIKVKGRNVVWDVEDSKKDLIWYKRHGQMNQRFTISSVGGDRVNIRSALGKCVTWSRMQRKFVMKRCEKKNKEQVFVVTGVDGKRSGEDGSSSSDRDGKDGGSSVESGDGSGSGSGGTGSSSTGSRYGGTGSLFSGYGGIGSASSTGSGSAGAGKEDSTATNVIGGSAGSASINGSSGSTSSANAISYVNPMSSVDSITNDSTVGGQLRRLMARVSPPQSSTQSLSSSFGFVSTRTPVKENTSLKAAMDRIEKHKDLLSTITALTSTEQVTPNTIVDSFGHPVDSLSHRLDVLFDFIPLEDKQKVLQLFVSTKIGSYTDRYMNSMMDGWQPDDMRSFIMAVCS